MLHHVRRYSSRMSGENTFVECPSCGVKFAPPKRTAFKAKVVAGGVTGGMIVGATAGATYGTGVGIASGGTAAAGTIPIGVVGGAIGGLVLGIGAKAGANWAAANVTCPAEGCETQFRM